MNRQQTFNCWSPVHKQLFLFKVSLVSLASLHPSVDGPSFPKRACCFSMPFSVAALILSFCSCGRAFFCVPRPFLRAAKEWKLQSYSTVCSNQKNGQVIYQCFSRIWLSISLLGCYALKKQMELQGNLWFDERLFYFSKYSKALQSNMMSLKKNKGVSSLEHGSRKLIIYSSSSSPKSPIEMYKESNNPASTVVFNVATITCIIGDLTLKSQCSSYVLTSFAGLMY